MHGTEWCSTPSEEFCPSFVGMLEFLGGVAPSALDLARIMLDIAHSSKVSGPVPRERHSV